jgi:hypothetical protein
MAFAIVFEVPGATAAQYDEVMKRLDERGGATSRLYHVAGASDDGWMVVDVWETKEAFEAFLSEHLIPVARQVGFFASLPRSFSVHNIVARTTS